MDDPYTKLQMALHLEALKEITLPLKQSIIRTEIEEN